MADSIDPIEYARGYVAALSYVSATSAREVHVLRLRSTFERAGIAHKLRYALRVLDLMREVQRLEGGYWFPTPLRAVPVGEQAVLVAPSPTPELRRHFRGVTRAGYARTLRYSDAEALPTEELNDWLRLDVQDSVAWSEVQIANARAGMGPTIVSGNVEFFSLFGPRSAQEIAIRPAWTKDARLCAQHKGVVLCRDRVQGTYLRHFLAQVEGGKVVGEGPTPHDLARMQYGLAGLVGKPVTIPMTMGEGEAMFDVPFRLPRAERQLVLALGVLESSFPGKVYRVRGANFISVVRDTLRRLGCEVRSARV